MSVQLLDKTRKINKLLHNNHSHRVEFNDICEVLSGILESNILVISQKGKILGAASYSGIDKIGELITADTGGFVDNMLNERLLGVLSTKENVNLLTLGFSGGSERKFKALIAPVDIAGERLGTLFIYKCVADYDIDDIILCEYGATVVGLEMMSSVNNENAEDERKKKIVKSAIKTLSASELQAVKAVFAHMDGMDGILVASRIADDTGITRSVIVNALKKCARSPTSRAKPCPRPGPRTAASSSSPISTKSPTPWACGTAKRAACSACASPATWSSGLRSRLTTRWPWPFPTAATPSSSC